MDVNWITVMGIVIGIPLGLFIAFSVIFMVGLYWTHYPYGRKGRKKWQRK